MDKNDDRGGKEIWTSRNGEIQRAKEKNHIHTDIHKQIKMETNMKTNQTAIEEGF